MTAGLVRLSKNDIKTGQQNYSSETIIEDQNEVWFNATGTINLKPGFHAKQGSKFKANIRPSCNSFKAKAGNQKRKHDNVSENFSYFCCPVNHLLYIIWDIDPQIFRIGEWGLRYYSILFASCFIVGWFIVQYFFKTENIPIRELDSLSMHMVIGTVVGARFGHAIFYEPQLFLNNPLEIFMVWHGGLASHGASLGLLVALYIFSRKSTKKSYMWVLDRAVIPIALAAVMIRLGNLMNSEIYGVETNAAWGFIFQNAGETLPRHPTQIYEALCYMALFIYLFRLYIVTKGDFPKGYIFGVFLTWTFATRFCIEFVKKNQAGFEKDMILNMGQLLSIPFILAGIFFIIKSRRAQALKGG